MAKEGYGKAALLLRSERKKIVRIRGNLGRVEERGGAMDQDVLDSDYSSQRSDIRHSRPNASNPSS